MHLNRRSLEPLLRPPAALLKGTAAGRSLCSRSWTVTFKRRWECLCQQCRQSLCLPAAVAVAACHNIPSLHQESLQTPPRPSPPPLTHLLFIFPCFLPLKVGGCSFFPSSTVIAASYSRMASQHPLCLRRVTHAVDGRQRHSAVNQTQWLTGGRAVAATSPATASGHACTQRTGGWFRKGQSFRCCHEDGYSSGR